MSIEKLIPLLRRLDRLSPEQRREILAGSVGDVELDDEALEAVAGGGGESTECVATLGCCSGLTNPNSCEETCSCSDTTVQ